MLHTAYINVAIAIILRPKRSLYDLQKPSYEKSRLRFTQRWAWPILKGPPIELGVKLFFGGSGPFVGQVDTKFTLPPSSSRSKQKCLGLYITEDDD